MLHRTLSYAEQPVLGPPSYAKQATL